MADDYSASTATTGVVAVNGSTTGTIETSLDSDWFAVTLTAGHTYAFKSEGASTGQGSLLTPYIALLDSGGNSVISNGDGPAGLTYTVTSGGTYYLAIGSAGNNPKGA